jgi:hypothetical protein
MTTHTINPQNSSLTLPITKTARRIAEQFAQHHTPEKAEKIRLNTLAVLLVNDYLQIMDIPTNLQASDSWNAAIRFCADVADLEIIGIGKLECRSMKPNQSTCYIPPEVWGERIGYVVVQIDESLREAKLLGFTARAETEELAVSQLQPLLTLLEHLQPPADLVRLRQWLEGIFEQNWRGIEELSREKNPAVALRFRTQRVRGMEIDNTEKVRRLINQLYANRKGEKIPDSPIDALVNIIQTTQDEETRWTAAEILWTLEPHHPATGVRRVMDLGMQLRGQAVALMVSILRKSQNKVAVLLRVYPMGSQRYLPSGLELAGLYVNGTPFLQAQARGQDDYIQLKFSADFGEGFSVRVSLGDDRITEHFVV